VKSSKIYLKELSEKAKIPADKQLDLLKKWKQYGDKKSFNLLYESIIKAVPKVALSLRPADSPHYMDLIQEGNLTVYNALCMYNPKVYDGSVFFYSMSLVKKAMSNFLLANEKPVKIKNSKYVKLAIELTQQNPTNEEVGAFIEKNKLKKEMFIPVYNRVKSSAACNSDDSEVYYEQKNSEESVIRKDLIEKVKKELSYMDGKSKNIIVDYFLNGQNMSVIGRKNHIARQRVQQIINSELGKLRNKMD
jgi:RNA polymerase sigma factor (sigma-70 family)